MSVELFKLFNISNLKYKIKQNDEIGEWANNGLAPNNIIIDH